MQSVLKLIAVHFQFMEDDMDIITCPRTLRVFQWSSGLEFINYSFMQTEA